MSIALPQLAEFPLVRSTLQQLLQQIRRILGSQFVGMYLYGSLAVGDFSRFKSDIDFLIITEEAISPLHFELLAQMHRQFFERGHNQKNKWAAELEGSYMSRVEVRRYDPQKATHPHIRRARADLQWEHHIEDWVMLRFVLRNQGLVVAGPALEDLIDPISASDMRVATLALLQNWWAPKVVDKTPLASPFYRCYLTLTLCRMLYTTSTGRIASKPVAAQWVEQRFGGQWHSVINKALQWSPANAPELDSVILFFEFTWAYCRNFSEQHDDRERI